MATTVPLNAGCLSADLAPPPRPLRVNLHKIIEEHHGTRVEIAGRVHCTVLEMYWFIARIFSGSLDLSIFFATLLNSLVETFSNL